MEAKSYSSCGNSIIVTVLENINSENLLKLRIPNDVRKELVELSKKYPCDSMMCLANDWETNPATIVFEPNAVHPQNLGGFSTMCGNGIRAVAEFINNSNPRDLITIDTLSGKLVVQKLENKWKVKMGKLYNEETHLKNYINKLQKFDNEDFSVLGFGFTSTTEGSSVDGEPHLTLRCNDGLDLDSLYTLANLYGPIITKDLKSFPHEINCNFISFQENGDLNLVTHERNLGNDPARSITQACGTGTTVSAGLLLNTINKIETLIVNCLGGQLKVDSDEENNLFLTGPVLYTQDIV